MRSPNQLSWRSPYTMLTLLIGIAIIVLGVNFMVHPHAGAMGYGVTVSTVEADAFLRAKGLRDVAAGLFIFCLVGAASARTVALFMITATVIPFGDALIVAMSAGAPAYAVPMHAGTALLMLVLGISMLRRGSRLKHPAAA